MAIQELKLEFSFFPLYVSHLACASFAWHEKQQAGCESLLSSFLTCKICLANTPLSPPPSFNPFFPPVQLTTTPNAKSIPSQLLERPLPQ